jgi:hypothetical protein
MTRHPTPRHGGGERGNFAWRATSAVPEGLTCAYRALHPRDVAGMVR